MKISDDDRSITKEVADLLDVPEDDLRTRRMLSIVFWAHRQLPADVVEKPVPVDRRLCHKRYAGDVASICVRARGHEGYHEALVAWSPEPFRWTFCDAVFSNRNPDNIIRCHRPSGHSGHHETPAGQTWSG